MRQIAEGGFSTIDLVEDCETGKKFAIKRILCHSIEDQNVALQVDPSAFYCCAFKPKFHISFLFFFLEKLHQFPQEVRVTRKLSHPNIVKVVGASTRGQADILHNLTSEVLIVFPLYQVVHNFCPFAAILS